MSDSAHDLLQFERALTRAAPLSATGHARRQTMRAALVATVVRRRRVRRGTRFGLGAAALAVGVWLAFALQATRTPSRTPPTQPRDALAGIRLEHADFALASNDHAQVAAWMVNRTGPSPDWIGEAFVRNGGTPRHLDFAPASTSADAIAAMLAPPRDLPPEIRIGDDEVLLLLARANRPTGLVRSAAGVHFTTDVFDPIGSAHE